jgi:hypothetical protein
VRALGKEPFSIVKLPETDTLVEARAKASKLGLMAYGVIPTHAGLAIRVKVEERMAMEMALMPDYTPAVGDQLVNMPKGEGYRIQIMGVPRSMTDI